ncbi:YHYH protein [Maribacter sp. SA7]|uniref:YHYH protein n=1 Tax=Maribacter zhoushanensis TaxID=3030012 RepID=UPI0023EB25EA|nr:YHYH protein [Maribacter zhoushanensis]MDF4203716.1 YHYH protein [Maribacter zhoushanensis]
MCKNLYTGFLIAIFLVSFTGCKNAKSSNSTASNEVTISVKKENFLTGSLVEPITIVSKEMSDGTTADCYKIITSGIPSEHDMGPWCPDNISDDASKGGVWAVEGEIYDIDGEFIKNLGTLFNDDTWMLYDKTTGEITKTKTKAECNDAADPNVGEEYKNFCVECLPSYITGMTHTYYIPVTPKKAPEGYAFRSGPPNGGEDVHERPERPKDGERPKGPPPGGEGIGPSNRGLAFNGVVFNAPAPVDNILAAYTIAPFDDAGGHINLHEGYHYHAATGVSKKIEQDDNHAPMIGYAMDGYPIFANTDADGNEATDLDEFRGQYDEIRGYHYHVDKAGSNNFIDGLRGVYVK